MNCFHQCRLKFYFRYVLGLQKPKSSDLHVGSVVHAVLQAWNLARWRLGKVDQEELKNVFGTSWVDEQAEQPVRWEHGEEEAERSSSWRLVEMYLRDTPIAVDEKPEAVEVFVEVDLASRGLPKLIGYIDLVRKGGRVVDYKTASKTPSENRATHLNETQLTCYGLLYREATGTEASGFELHHLVKLKTPKLVVTSFEAIGPAQETRLFRIMESYQKGVQAEDWVPSPNPMSCACCEFYNECRNWG